jgi:2-dehydro-3-deoxygluconokinase
MGVRITPENRQSVQTSHLFYMQSTSAESNVLNIASSLGHECLALTKFIEGSPVSLFIQGELRARNIRYEASACARRPWGYRHSSSLRIEGSACAGRGWKIARRSRAHARNR